MAMIGNNFGFNQRMVSMQSSITLQAGGTNTEKNDEAKPCGIELSEHEFNMNYENYKGCWIYYVQPNGIAHAKYINKRGDVSKVCFCSPEKAARL